jgi:NitT/TauT family transport system substrate-binding protein
MMKTFYEQGGVTISEASMKKEFATRPTYDLAGQLKIMHRPAGGTSEVDGWFAKIGAFMQVNGTFAEAPAPNKFISDEYLKMVDADPKLKAFANRAD